MISYKQDKNLGHNTKGRNLPRVLGKLRVIEVLFAREGQHGAQGSWLAVCVPAPSPRRLGVPGTGLTLPSIIIPLYRGAGPKRRSWGNLPEGPQEVREEAMGAQGLALAPHDSCVPQGGVFRRESRQAWLRGSSEVGSLG